ncbi:TetR/AcrR family transcriptional regulator [Xylophilus rhododendri]|uniref:TetR/AcrR family transcriptional regulator n=1 Tax=Xylophilus rhododendri TaxID=2697032 RepID=UPI001E5AE6FA|nr:TetR/AcrR family transcriptional regulator [Xylophilus rhododendri]
MKSADKTPSPARPSKPERDELRRVQIVGAARSCVLRHGFHAASMAQIAEEARMSVGQIYRYFANKEAIVHAIVERIVSDRLAWIASTGRQTDLPRVLAGRMLSDEDAEDHALLLEVTAEAARNPAVAEIVRLADRRLHAQAVATVRLDHPHLDAAQAAARVEFMAVLHEGTAFRRLTDQPADPVLLAEIYREVIARLLPGPLPPNGS